MKYILRINSLCKSCGYRNVIEKETDEKIEIVACGHCGTFIMIPNDMGDEDRKLVEGVINKAIEEGPDALL